MACHGLLSEASNVNFPFLPNTERYTTSWPGFYCGANKWHIPERAQFDFEDMNWDNKTKILKRELQKIGIELY
jgi:hypothetical protein